MANTKHLFSQSTTGANIYVIARRLSDNFLLDDADGIFKTGTPADPYVSLSENSVEKGVYEVSENRSAWSDDRYRLTFYKRVGGAPAPATDAPPISVVEVAISGDAIVFEQTSNNTLLYLRSAALTLARLMRSQVDLLNPIQLQLNILDSFVVSIDKAQRRPAA